MRPHAAAHSQHLPLSANDNTVSDEVAGELLVYCVDTETAMKSRQRGMTLPLMALFIVVLFAVAALAIDLGVLYTARTSAQHAADAAALAGAFTFLDPSAVEPTAATNAAIAAAAKNTILGQKVTIAGNDVAVDTGGHTVTVTVSRMQGNGIPTAFAKVIGINLVGVKTQARAQASSTPTGGRCVKPFFLPNTLLSQLKPTDACNAGQYIFTPGNYQQLSPWILGQGLGQLIDTRPISPSDALAPSQFYSLDFGSGASTYSCAIAQCLNACDISSPISCGGSWPLETGEMAGPTNQGIKELIGNPPDTYISIGQYQTSTGISNTSQSLIVAPVWDNCTQKLTSGTNGQTPTVIGFLELFIVGTSGNDVKSRLISAAGCDMRGGGGTLAGSTGPLAYPVRLIQ
jgi:Flp pilus assembly protein TadG